MLRVAVITGLSCTTGYAITTDVDFARIGAGVFVGVVFVIKVATLLFVGFAASDSEVVDLVVV